MKKAKDLIIGCEHDGSYIPVNEVLNLIKLAQIDAIEETCKVCAENVELKEFDKTPQDIDSICNDMGDVYAIDLEKILAVSEKLKKELK